MGRVLAYLFLVAPVFAQSLVFSTLAPEVIRERFLQVQPDNAERADVLRKMFAESGCPADQWSEPKVRGSKLSNLICTLPGATGRRIIITAHFDKVARGKGAIDNWSGVSLLPSLFACLSARSRNLSFTFLATTDEERDLVGARAFVKSLSKAERADVHVNVDSIGLPGPLYVWVSRANKQLLDDAAIVGGTVKVKLAGMNVDGAGDTDSAAFLGAGIPVIDFHSLNSKTIRLLHSEKDVPEAVDASAEFEAYRFLCAYLAYLDLKPPSR